MAGRPKSTSPKTPAARKILRPEPIKPLPSYLKIAKQPPAVQNHKLYQRATPELRPFVEYHLGRFGGCQNCALHESACRHVFFRGYVPAEVLFIGGAPDQGADLTGKPFSGTVGQIMDRIVMGVSMHVQDEIKWCMTNTVMCRPPKSTQDKDRDPKAAEIAACRMRLINFIQLVQPRVIVTVGKLADKALPGIDKMAPFPPEADWPLWAAHFVDQTILNELWAITAKKNPRGLKRPTPQRLQWKPVVCTISHPGWILRQEFEDQAMEEQRAILRVADAVEQSRRGV